MSGFDDWDTEDADWITGGTNSDFEFKEIPWENGQPFQPTHKSKLKMKISIPLRILSGIGLVFLVGLSLVVFQAGKDVNDKAADPRVDPSSAAPIELGRGGETSAQRVQDFQMELDVSGEVNSNEASNQLPSRNGRVVGTEISFLSFNVCKSNCTAPAPEWEVRRQRIANVIIDSNVSVIGLQEVTNWQVKGGRTQWNDIQDLVAAAGFVAPAISAKFINCGGDGNEGCVDTARILFNANDLVQMQTDSGEPAAGYDSLGGIAKGIDPEARDRSVAWAYLQAPLEKQILAISLHMDSDKSDISEQSRVEVAQQINAWIEGTNQLVGIQPDAVVLMADLNSYDARQPVGAQTILAQSGWQDGITASRSMNTMYSTINYTPDTRHFGGWPPKPRYFNRLATRIDYIFVSGEARLLEYEVMIWLKSNGQFDEDYQASDHQSVRVIVKI